MIVLPELVHHGIYLRGSVFAGKAASEQAKRSATARSRQETAEVDAIRICRTTACVQRKTYITWQRRSAAGKCSGIVPKTYLPNYNEFY